MKIYLMLITLMSLFANPSESSFSSEYDIEGIYKTVSVDYDTKAITRMGSVVEDIDYILVKTNVDEGNYRVRLTRKDTNLYKIEGADLYVMTKYCYEYCYNEEVILKIYNVGGYSYGKVVFD